jgi:hypothetical protein
MKETLKSHGDAAASYLHPSYIQLTLMMMYAVFQRELSLDSSTQKTQSNHSLSSEASLVSSLISITAFVFGRYVARQHGQVGFRSSHSRIQLEWKI